MFGSQALETAIGLVLMFFVIALASSSIVEIYSRMLKKRGKDLEAVILVMLKGQKPANPGEVPTTTGPMPSPANPSSPTDLERAAINAWLTHNPAYSEWAQQQQAFDAWTNARDLFQSTSVFASLQAAGKTGASTGLLGLRWLLYWVFRRFDKNWQPTRLPSYISATAFADVVSEMIVDQGAELTKLPPGLAKRLEPIVREVGDDATRIKAGVERWFDDTMERMEGSYKRWATVGLFVTALVITAAANAGTIDVARSLWTDPATRQVIVEATSGVVGRDTGAECPIEDSAATVETTPLVGCQIKSIAATVDSLDSLGLPIGWDAATQAKFSPWYNPGEWGPFGRETASMLIGWLVTALLVMLGAPFWFDLLSRLVALRSSGAKPTPSAKDPSSNTAAEARWLGAASPPRGASDPDAALKSAFGFSQPG